MFDVKRGALQTFMHEGVLAPSMCPLPDSPRERFCHRLLRPLAQNLQRLPTDERQLLAQFRQGFEFFSLRWAEKTFVVAVHEFLQATVRFRWKMKLSNSFHPVQRCRNRRAHGIILGWQTARVNGT